MAFLSGLDRRSRLFRPGLALIAVLAVVYLVLLLRGGHSAPAHLEGKVSNHGTRTVRDGSTTEVLLEDTSYNPTFIVGPPGARVTLHLQDQGFHAHTFTVPDQNIDVTVAPNQSTTVTVMLPSSGAVSYFCRFHRDLGMQGALVAR